MTALSLECGAKSQKNKLFVFLSTMKQLVLLAFFVSFVIGGVTFVSDINTNSVGEVAWTSTQVEKILLFNNSGNFYFFASTDIESLWTSNTASTTFLR